MRRRILLYLVVVGMLLTSFPASARDNNLLEEFAKEPTSNRITPPGQFDEPFASFGAVQLIRDGGFEAGLPNPHWVQIPTNSPTIICSVAICGNGGGTTGPRTGNWWGWMGGFIGEESSSLSQVVTIPEGSATLSFWLWVGLVTTSGFFKVEIDGNEVFGITEADAFLYGSYAQISKDVSSYADGGSHTIKFRFFNDQFGLNNISIDDVSLQAIASGANDEMFFYRDDGLFRYYNIKPNGTLGSPILAGVVTRRVGLRLLLST